MKIQGVIFDFNGTLLFDSDYHFLTFQQLKKEITGSDLTLEEMESKYSGKPNVEIFKEMSQGSFSKEECERYSQKKECLYRELLKKSDASLCDGAEEMFSLLNEHHIPFTIASASIKENIDFFVEMFHLDQWMDHEKIVYDDGSYINKIEMFQDAKRKIGVKDNVLIFEDSLSGIDCAAHVGASLIVIHRENLEKYYSLYPSIIKTVKNLKEAIPSIEAML